MDRMQQLASLALLEVRFFPRCEDGQLDVMHTSFNMDWMLCLQTAEAAATVCEVTTRCSPVAVLAAISLDVVCMCEGIAEIPAAHSGSCPSPDARFRSSITAR